MNDNTQDSTAASPKINNPKLDEKGKPQQKAVSDFRHAHAISKRLYDDAVAGRLTIAAVVSDKYNGATPYVQAKLNAADQGWRNNFTTQFLASIIDRVRPQFLDPINRAERITFSSLPPEVTDAAEKSRKFQERITKLIRKWPEWNDFNSMLTQEIVVHGGALPGSIDDNWRPMMFRTDEAYLPEGTGQHASKVQIILYLQKVLIHDFLQMIGDERAAADEGYDIKGCREAVGTADSEREQTPVERSDAERENAGHTYSFQNANKTVDLFHLLVREWDGTVHLWTTSVLGGKPVRHVEGIFSKIEDAVTVFTLQTGNTKFYGAKGLGRLLCNLHVAIERNRCLAADLMYLSGLMILKGDPTKKLQVAIQSPFIVVDGDVAMAKEMLQFDAQNFLALDKMFVGLAESIAGAFIPPNLDNTGSSNTKIEAAAKAEREMAVRQGVLGRFFGQYAEMVGGMQRKICSPLNLKEAYRIYKLKSEMKTKGFRGMLSRLYSWIEKVVGPEELKAQQIAPIPETKIADKEAVEALVDLLEGGLSVEEIVLLADTPTGNEIQEQGAELDQRTVAFLMEERENAYIDQRASTEMRANITIGKDRAQRVVIGTKPDPNEENLALREQMQEFALMLDGTPVPVVSKDNHLLHRKALTGMLTPVLQTLQMAPTPDAVQVARLGTSHYVEHLQNDQQVTEEQRAQEEQALQQWMGLTDAAEAAIAQLQAEAAKQGYADPSQMPPALPGQPGAVSPEMELEAARMEAENSHKDADREFNRESKTREQELKLRDQDLKEKQFEHQRTMDIVKIQKEDERAQQEAAVRAAERETKQLAGAAS